MQNVSVQEQLQKMAQAIFDKKGSHIFILDVKGICFLTDYFVIAEGTVDRHVRALANAVIETLSHMGKPLLKSEGLRDGEWVVLDFGDIMVHLLTSELRERYHLEGVWHEGKIVNVKIDTGIK